MGNNPIENFDNNYFINSSSLYSDQIDEEFPPIRDENFPNQDPNFESISKIMNPHFSNQEEEDLDEEKEKNLMFLGQKRNHDTNPEEEQEVKEKIQNVSEQKETKPSTGKDPKIKKIKKNIFSISQKNYRNDYYIKKMKVEIFSNYATQKLNDLFTNCGFPKHLNIRKIYMLNNAVFTSEASLKKNEEFLDKKIQDTFSMENGKGRYQIKNRINFNTIFNSRNEARNKQAYERLINFLNMTVEDVIREFYCSEEFLVFKENQEIIEYDEAFYKEKKFSLLKGFGLIDLITGNY